MPTTTAHEPDQIGVEDRRSAPHFWAFNAIFDDDRLTANDTLVYLALCRRVNAAGLCWPSTRRIGADCKLSRASVFRSLAGLVTHGWISRRMEGKRGQTTVYVILPVPAGESHTETGRGGRGPSHTETGGSPTDTGPVSHRDPKEYQGRKTQEGNTSEGAPGGTPAPVGPPELDEGLRTRHPIKYLLTAFDLAFWRHHEARTGQGERHPPMSSKEPSQAARLLGRYRLDTCLLFVDRFFTLDEDWIERSGRTFGVFVSQIGKVIAAAPQSSTSLAKQRVIGTHPRTAGNEEVCRRFVAGGPLTLKGQTPPKTVLGMDPTDEEIRLRFASVMARLVEHYREPLSEVWLSDLFWTLALRPVTVDALEAVVHALMGVHRFMPASSVIGGAAAVWDKQHAKEVADHNADTRGLPTDAYRPPNEQDALFKASMERIREILRGGTPSPHNKGPHGR